MANESTTSTLAGLIDDISGKSIFVLNREAGILDVVDLVDTTGIPGKTYDFAKYSTPASSDVTAVAEATDHSTNYAVTNADVAATVAENVIMATITDLSILSTPRNKVVNDTALLFSSAIRAKLEDDVVGLFGSFSQTVAGAGTTMTIQHWYDSLRQIVAGGGNPGNCAAVISPKQFYGAKGLQPLVGASGMPATPISDEIAAKGFIANPFGVKLLVSNEINEDVGSGGDAAGAIFDMRAIGLHTKSIFSVETERNASLRGFELVAVGRWKAVELVDAYGVYMLTDVA